MYKKKCDSHLKINSGYLSYGPSLTSMEKFKFFKNINIHFQNALLKNNMVVNTHQYI